MRRERKQTSKWVYTILIRDKRERERERQTNPIDMQFNWGLFVFLAATSDIGHEPYLHGIFGWKENNKKSSMADSTLYNIYKNQKREQKRASNIQIDSTISKSDYTLHNLLEERKKMILFFYILFFYPRKTFSLWNVFTILLNIIL